MNIIEYTKLINKRYYKLSKTSFGYACICNSDPNYHACNIMVINRITIDIIPFLEEFKASKIMITTTDKNLINSLNFNEEELFLMQFKAKEKNEILIDKFTVNDYTYKINIAKESDLDIIKLYEKERQKEAFGQVYLMNSLEKKIMDTDFKYVYVTNSKNEVVMSAIISFKYNFIENISVLKRFRGLGIGTEFLRTVSSAFNELNLLCENENLSFYKECGFKKIDFQTDFTNVFNKTDIIAYFKDL